MENKEDTGVEEIEKWVSETCPVDQVIRLPGDASTRCYYRIDSKGKSFVVMKMEAFQSSGTPFLAVQKHLFDSGVDVPEVLAVSPEQGLLLLEDLGDTVLLRKLQDVSSAEVERHLYQKVIDSLVQLQVAASPAPGKKAPDLEAFHLNFDHKKLMWEVNFTIEHFYEKYLQRNLSKHDRDVIEKSFSEICTFLAEQPKVLTHRDFHSRNIMCHADRLVMIDFQDARMGPAQYDLVSLLKDSYYQLEETQVNGLIDYYIAKWEAHSGKKIHKEAFRKTFDLMAVQRNFKAIGSFASFLNRRGNATYLKFIGNTFENIRRTLLRYPSYSHLREVLFHYYYF